MQRKIKNSPSVRTGSKKQVGGVSMPQTTFGPPRTFKTSPSDGHHMLSSTVADTKQPATSSKKSVLSTVSTSMKQRVSPGSIDDKGYRGYGLDISDDISDLDGLAKIIPSNITTSSDTSIHFDPQCCSIASHSSSYTDNSATATVQSFGKPRARYTMERGYTLEQPPSSTSTLNHSSPSSTFEASQSSKLSQSQASQSWSSPSTTASQSWSSPSTTASSVKASRFGSQVTWSSTSKASSFAPDVSNSATTMKHPPSSTAKSSTMKHPPSSTAKSSTMKQRSSSTSKSSTMKQRSSSTSKSSTMKQRSSFTSKSSSTLKQRSSSTLKSSTRKQRSSSTLKSSNLKQRSSSPLKSSSFSPGCPPCPSGTIPSFTGPVTVPILGRTADTFIDLLSSSDSESDSDMPDDMPDLVSGQRCDSSSDEESDEDSTDAGAKTIIPSARRSTRIPPNVPLPSYFEGEDDDDDDDDDEEDGEVSFGFGFNRYYSKPRKRSKKRQSKKPSCAPKAIPPQSIERYCAGSKIWSGPLCPKGICLVVQTETEVHVVQDCPAGQVYIFRQLSSLVHLQQVDSELAAFLKAGFAKDFPVLLYRMNRNHVTSFCVIFNESNTNSPILDSMDFNKLNRLLSEVDPLNVYGCLRQAKRSSISYGYASSRCTRRDECGTSVPNLLKNTLEPVIKDLFVSMSSIFRLEMLPIWAKFIPDAKRLPFAASIAPDNVLEGLTIHLTNRKNLLLPHKDVNNPVYDETSQLALVVGACRWVDGNRIGTTAYFRKSISVSMVRSDVMAPLLEELTTVYSKLPLHRRHLNPTTFEEAHKEGCHLDTNHFTIPCNIDPMGFLTLFIHPTCVLQHVFHLSLLQVISVLMCMDIFPNSAYFFDLAVFELVERKVLYHGEAAAIGQHLATRMVHYRDLYYAHKTTRTGKRLKLGVFRYHSSKQFPLVLHLLSPSDWIECAVKKLVVCLFIWKRAPTKPNLTTIDGIYDSCSALFQDTVHGMGPLSAKHQLSVLSALGCVPSWLRTYTSVEGRVLEFFEKRYPKLAWTGLAGRKTLSGIQTYLQNRFHDIWEILRVENLLCKVYRLINPNGSDSAFVDIHRNDQILIVEVESRYSIHFANGKVVQLSTNSLCNQWEVVGQAMVPTPEIANYLQLELVFESVDRFPTLDKLMRSVDISRVNHSFPGNQQSSSLLFTF